MDAAGWDARYATTDLVWSAEPNRWVVETFEARPPGRGLDLGAGEGRNTLWLAERGWDVTAPPGFRPICSATTGPTRPAASAVPPTRPSSSRQPTSSEISRASPAYGSLEPNG